MQRIHIDKIEDGLILAKPVLDNFGNVILNAGFVLNPAWTGRLKLRKIEYVFVEDSETETPKAAPTTREEKLKVAAEVSKLIDEMFSDVITDERMQYLAGAAKRFHLKRELEGP